MATDNDKKLSAAELEAAFQAARDQPPMPSQELWARVLADGDAHLPRPPGAFGAASAVAAARPRPRFAAFAGILAAIGGWGGLAGLASAAIVGVWIGYAHPGVAPHPPGAGVMAGGGQTGFELEDFEPRYVDFSALLEDG